jgi:tRNA threonylcarbamoyl adenosine modification protein YjeE
METWTLDAVDERRLTLLAEVLALALKPGDLVTLSGDLGAGKSTFARALIRAALDDALAEVPSPTFSLIQTYATSRFEIAHLDLYRLASADELSELGLDEALTRGPAIVEWPEQAATSLPPATLKIAFRETPDPNLRTLDVAADDRFAERMVRCLDILAFLQPHLTDDPAAHVAYLQGDASARRYARITTSAGSRVLMDSPRRPDGPPVRHGLPYSRIAHLAEDVRPFVAIADALRAAGLSTPTILAADLARGLLLIEDFGDRVFGTELAAGASQRELWKAATEALVELRSLRTEAAFPLPDGTSYRPPNYDADALAIETELLVDWLWPLVKGSPAPAEVRREFADIWSGLIATVLAEPPALVLRDYHSPNLMWLPEREGTRRVGLLDFQDAVIGSAAYDLVSLLQDARLDVPAEIERELFALYVARVRAREPGFEAAAFTAAYAILGVQRNTKILGIFARLAMRDGKPRYLGHLPRIWGYLGRGLEHDALAPLAAWYRRHWPAEDRAIPAWPPTDRRELR